MDKAKADKKDPYLSLLEDRLQVTSTAVDELQTLLHLAEHPQAAAARSCQAPGRIRQMDIESTPPKEILWQIYQTTATTAQGRACQTPATGPLEACNRCPASRYSMLLHSMHSRGTSLLLQWQTPPEHQGEACLVWWHGKLRRCWTGRTGQCTKDIAHTRKTHTWKGTHSETHSVPYCTRPGREVKPWAVQDLWNVKGVGGLLPYLKKNKLKIVQHTL